MLPPNRMSPLLFRDRFGLNLSALFGGGRLNRFLISEPLRTSYRFDEGEVLHEVSIAS